MAHIAERMSTHYLAVIGGYEVTDCPDPGQIAAYAREVRPQIMFGVPRVWEKIYAGVQAALGADPEKKAKFDEAVAAAIPIVGAPHARARPPPRTTPPTQFLDEAAFAGVRALVGLDAVEYAITGAAPIPAELISWYRAIGVPLSEIYGMSESTGPMTWEPHRVKAGTVGVAFPGTECFLADDGEVCIRGGNVFLGYLDDPEKTAEALDPDGTLHSGDIGEFDDEGYLRIIDRKKELIITAGGKNISPANLEAALKMIPLVGQACAIGDQRPFVSALVVLDAEVAPVWAKEHGIEFGSLAELAEHPDVDRRGRHGPRGGDGRVQQRRAGEEGEDPRRGVAARLRGAHAHVEAQAARHPRQVRRRDRSALRLTREPEARAEVLEGLAARAGGRRRGPSASSRASARSFSPERAGVGEDVVERSSSGARGAVVSRTMIAPGPPVTESLCRTTRASFAEVEPRRLGQALGLARGGEGDEVHEVAGQLGARARAGRAHVHRRGWPSRRTRAWPARRRSRSPPTIAASVPSWAPMNPPLTGTSSRSTPCADAVSASSSAVSGRIVECTAMTVAGRAVVEQLGDDGAHLRVVQHHDGHHVAGRAELGGAAGEHGARAPRAARRPPAARRTRAARPASRPAAPPSARRSAPTR